MLICPDWMFPKFIQVRECENCKQDKFCARVRIRGMWQYLCRQCWRTS